MTMRTFTLTAEHPTQSVPLHVGGLTLPTVSIWAENNGSDVLVPNDVVTVTVKDGSLHAVRHAACGWATLTVVVSA